MSNETRQGRAERLRQHTAEKALYYNERAAHYLAEGNAASERGDQAKAEDWYAKSQRMLDRYNKAAGNL